VTIYYITSILYLTLGIIIIILGMIILKDNIKQRINRITGIMMLLAGTGPIFGAFGILMQSVPDTYTSLQPLSRLFLVWEFFFPQMLLFSFVYPQEIKFVKQKAYLKYLIFIPHIIHFLMVFIFSSPEQVRNVINLQSISDKFGLIIQPVTITIGFILTILSLIYKFHANFFALINLIYIITAISLMLWGYSKLQNQRLKKQVGLVLWGIRASVGLYAIAFIFPHLHISLLSRSISYLLVTGALLIGAGSIAWAIIKYKFLDIRFIIRKGLIFSLATAILISFYLIIFEEGKKILARFMPANIPAVEIISILFVLLFFQPILNTIERFIEKFFMRDRLDYRNVLQDLSRDILTTLDPEALKTKIITTLKDTMSLTSAELIMRTNDGKLVLNKPDKSMEFRENEEWIQHLKNNDQPTGFYDLSLQTHDHPGLESLRKLNPVLLIPFIHRQKLSGILLLGEKIAKTTFSAEEMMILSVLSSQAAIALENAFLYTENLEKQKIQEELLLAREIQTNLLPKDPPKSDVFDIAGHNIPSKEVGGDYYDYFILDNGHIGIAIGDISGKGVPASLLMSNLQAALRISSLDSHEPHVVLSRVNKHITKTTSPEKFATFFYGVFDPGTKTFTYTNAGHNYPILLRKNGKIELLKQGGLIIGVMEHAEYSSASVELGKGDALVLYTDGVTEAMDIFNNEFGEERLINLLKETEKMSARGIINTILERISSFTQGSMFSDDLTLIVMKIK